MSETKWTPAPWVTHFREDGSCLISMGNDVTGPHKQFDIPLERGEWNDEADAALIAAAPELYQVLEEMDQRVRELCACYSHPLPVASLERSAAALAKARGEQP